VVRAPAPAKPSLHAYSAAAARRRQSQVGRRIGAVSRSAPAPSRVTVECPPIAPEDPPVRTDMHGRVIDRRVFTYLTK